MPLLERRTFLIQALMCGGYALAGPAGHSLTVAQVARRPAGLVLADRDNLARCDGHDAMLDRRLIDGQDPAGLDSDRRIGKRWHGKVGQASGLPKNR